MVENLKKINLLDKKFEFVRKNNDRLVYKFENKEFGQLDILELLISEEEQRIMKIDIYSFFEAELSETMHIIRGTDNMTEVDYYPEGYENVSIDGVKDIYNINIYLLYNETQEHKEIQLIKKGHQKHKILVEMPLSGYYITKNNKIHYISSTSINKLKQSTEFLLPSINEIEHRLFNEEEEEQLDHIDDKNIPIIELANGTYPNEIYVYDRIYHLLGKRNKAVIYQSDGDEIKELEIYFTDDNSKIKEVRLIDYYYSFIDEIQAKSKSKIIRFLRTNDGKVSTTLCNRKRESMIINTHTIDKNNISARAITTEKGILEALNVKITNQLGLFNLKKIPNKNVELFDDDGNCYLVSSNSFAQFSHFIMYSPFILNTLEKNLIKDVNNKELVLTKK